MHFTHEGIFEWDRLEGIGTCIVEARQTNAVIKYSGEFKR